MAQNTAKQIVTDPVSRPIHTKQGKRNSSQKKYNI